MHETRLVMGMPVSVELADATATQAHIDRVFAYFTYIDETFSTYKESSEISQINNGQIDANHYSEDMRTILRLSEETKQQTQGYFDIAHDGHLDPSGIVKGWAIHNAARLLDEANLENYIVDAGGDMQVAGKKETHLWRIGIRNPFNRHENVKVLALTDCGIATSGTAIRGQHIYDPHHPDKVLSHDILSMTVIAPNVYEADRFATAAFAMGRKGLSFIEALSGFEGYLIDAQARATYTSGFSRYVLS